MLGRRAASMGGADLNSRLKRAGSKQRRTHSMSSTVSSGSAGSRASSRSAAPPSGDPNQLVVKVGKAMGVPLNKKGLRM